jgi:hypothetical protein
MYGSLIVYNSGLIFLALLAFALLHWLQIPTGNLVDWIIGIAIFEWLLIIVTVPWNIYFAAQATVQEGKESQSQGITVEQRQLKYADSIAKRSLILAIGLHLISAAGLYGLAVGGVTPLGYLSSGAALLLTLLRPAISTYEYLAMRLMALREQFKYPRADILELRNRFQELEYQVGKLNQQLNPEDETSWLSEQNRRWENNRAEIAKLTAAIADFKASNELEHHRLSQEAKQAISQITVDGQFLEHVREIIRFFKTA